MALTIPANFLSDIQGRDTALVPLVVIGNHSSEDNSTGTYIWISTNSGKLLSEVDEEALPLLLNVPSLKESIDIEKRNYKISNVNIDISNYEYNGIRASDRLTNAYGSVINQSCRIFWVSPSTTNMTFADVSDYLGTSAFQVYYGKIRRYTHDDEKVKLVVEDRSQAILHRDLPQTNLGSGANVPDKGINKYVPMVYGSVDRSPIVEHYSINEEVDTDEVEVQNVFEYRLKADTENIGSWEEETIEIGDAQHKVSALYFYDNDSYHNVHRSDGELGDGVDAAGDPNGLINFRYGLTDIVLDIDGVDYGSGESSINNDFSKGHLRAHVIRRFTNVETWNEFQGNYVSGDMGLLTFDENYPDAKIGRMMGMIEIGAVNTDNEAGGSTWGAFKCILEPLTVPNNLAVDSAGGIIRPVTTLLADIVHYDFSTNLSDDAGTGDIPAEANSQPQLIASTVVPQTHWGVWNGDASVGWVSNGEHIGTFYMNSFEYNFDNINGGDWEQEHGVNQGDAGAIRDLSRWWSTLTAYDHVNIGIPRHYYWATATIGYPENHDHAHWGVDTIIKDAFIVQTYKVMGITDKDYYANVIGRLAEPTLPEVIAHIMDTELDVTGIDNTDTEYSGMKYAFTIDKKINSKKLIEGLASASPYIPHFDNVGNFKFDIINREYKHDDPVYDSDTGVGWHSIKADDVISSSFSRTKIEDVYTKVAFEYNWDYAKEKFNGKTSEHTTDYDNVVGNYSTAYYGLKSDHSESTLVIDDDRGKYIRDATTAKELAKWLLRFYCNQHLKIKVRLSLKYMNVEVGDIVRFDKIIDVKPYGIDYSETAHFDTEDIRYYGNVLNGQQVFPDFMATSTNKTLEYCEIECMQMHNLKYDNIEIGVFGCNIPEAWNYRPDSVPRNEDSLIPPKFENGVMTEEANENFKNMFLQSDVCPVLYSYDYESYNENYPDDDDPIFEEYNPNVPSTEYGQTLIEPNHGRYQYDNEVQIGIAKSAFGYVPEDDTFAMTPRLYRLSECSPTDVKEHELEWLQIKHFGMDFGYWGTDVTAAELWLDPPEDFQYSPPPPTTLYFVTKQTNGVDTGYRPNYNLVFGSFYYVPFPVWCHPDNGGDYMPTLINQMLMVNYNQNNMNTQDGYGNLKLNLQLKRKDIETTFSFDRMEVSINPTAIRQQVSPYHFWDEGVPIYDVRTIAVDPPTRTLYSADFDSSGMSSGDFGAVSFEIENLLIRHGDGSWVQEYTGETQGGQSNYADTYYYSHNVIWRIFLKIKIYNTHSSIPESDVSVTVVFGSSPDGNPIDTGGGGGGGGETEVWDKSGIRPKKPDILT